jgi:hypothetical protein
MKFKTICKNNIYQVSDRSTGYKLHTKMHENLNVGEWYELETEFGDGDRWYSLSGGRGLGYIFNDSGVGQDEFSLYKFFMNTEELRDYQIDKFNR